MSAIAGIWQRPGETPDRRALEAMVVRQRLPGQRRTAVLRNDNAVLAHTLVGDARDGLLHATADCLVTLDGRLDERRALAATLGLSTRAASTDDAALVLAAYLCWGFDCPDHLVGAFAFAIWDRQRQTLFCARDQLGERSFFYHRDDRGGFRFASTAKALLAADPRLADDVDPAVQADYMAGFAPPAAETIHRRIRRLPPAHRCIVTPEEMRVERYWHLDYRGAPPVRDVPGRFRELLDNAVEARISSGATAAMLSGGLDSSSICRLAADRLSEAGRGPLPTYSMIYPASGLADERAQIDAVVRQGGCAPRFVDMTATSPFAALDAILDEQDGPILAPNHAAARQLYAAAAAEGNAMLLDGHGGDEAVSFGAGRLVDLIGRGRWLACWRLLQSHEARTGQPAGPAFRQMLRNQDFAMMRGLVALRRRRTPAGPPAWARYLNPQLAREIDIVGRRTLFRPEGLDAWPAEQRIQYRQLAAPGQSDALETLARASAAAGVETRFPFLCRRLVEYSFQLPAAEKFADGHTRLVLRRAMAPLLPGSVCWRPDKYDFMPQVRRTMAVAGREQLSDLLLTPSPSFAAIADAPAVTALARRLLADPGTVDGAGVAALWRAVSMASWLDRSRHPRRADRPMVAEAAA